MCVCALTTLTCCLSSSLLSAVCGLCVSLFVLRGGQLPDESSALLTEPWSGENATLSPEIHTHTHTHTVNDMKLKIKDRKAATALEQHPTHPPPEAPLAQNVRHNVQIMTNNITNTRQLGTPLAWFIIHLCKAHLMMKEYVFYRPALGFEGPSAPDCPAARLSVI